MWSLAKDGGEPSGQEALDQDQRTGLPRRACQENADSIAEGRAGVGMQRPNLRLQGPSGGKLQM